MRHPVIGINTSSHRKTDKSTPTISSLRSAGAQMFSWPFLDLYYRHTPIVSLSVHCVSIVFNWL